MFANSTEFYRKHLSSPQQPNMAPRSVDELRSMGRMDPRLKEVINQIAPSFSAQALAKNVN